MRRTALILLLFIALDLSFTSKCNEDYDADSGSTVAHQHTALADGVHGGHHFGCTHECFCTSFHMQHERIVEIILLLPVSEPVDAVQLSGLDPVPLVPHHPPRLIAL